MTMSVEVVTRPNTLNEAELAKKIHGLVADAILEAGHTPSSPQVMHEVYDHATERWVSGPITRVFHNVHVDGAEIPRLVVAHETQPEAVSN